MRARRPLAKPHLIIILFPVNVLKIFYNSDTKNERRFTMEYLIILIIGAAIAVSYMYWQRTATEADVDRVEATYVCDECGEKYCDCHKVEE